MTLTQKELEAYILILVKSFHQFNGCPVILPRTDINFLSLSLPKPSEVRGPKLHLVLRTIHSVQQPVDVQCMWATSLQWDTVCEFLCVHKNMNAHVPMCVKSRHQY